MIQVWGVGPKIGGNSAGLLNFGTLPCPYAMQTFWEFGTKDETKKKRQVDRKLVVRCVSDVSTAKIIESEPSEKREIVDKNRIPNCGKHVPMPISAYGSNPWHARIVLSDPSSSSGLTHICSGVIVSEKFVLTSASCFKVSQPVRKYRILVGDYFLRQWDAFEKTYHVKDIFLHDNYNQVIKVIHFYNNFEQRFESAQVIKK